MKARLVLVGLLVTVPVLADAPARQYGAFVDTDVEITDRFTMLVWERPAPTATLSFLQAQEHCMNAGQRLPSMKELLTLVDEEPHTEYEGSKLVTKMIDPSAFKRTPTDADFWTSSPRQAGSYATVSFGTGLTSVATATDRRYVRCVTALM